ncbi:MAG: hypothetical protein HFF01_06410 [Erysipelotrichaceae bacterium]|nr:hypothetical protein [Erysipelotrichaceae bacterium]MCI9524666.1 hypothetical protein [Erysipelotrichaceae bacterium]
MSSFLEETFEKGFREGFATGWMHAHIEHITILLMVGRYKARIISAVTGLAVDQIMKIITSNFLH